MSPPLRAFLKGVRHYATELSQTETSLRETKKCIQRARQELHPGYSATSPVPEADLADLLETKSQLIADRDAIIAEYYAYRENFCSALRRASAATNDEVKLPTAPKSILKQGTNPCSKKLRKPQQTDFQTIPTSRDVEFIATERSKSPKVSFGIENLVEDAAFFQDAKMDISSLPWKKYKACIKKINPYTISTHEQEKLKDILDSPIVSNAEERIRQAKELLSAAKDTLKHNHRHLFLAVQKEEKTLKSAQRIHRCFKNALKLASPYSLKESQALMEVAQKQMDCSNTETEKAVESVDLALNAAGSAGQKALDEYTKAKLNLSAAEALLGFKDKLEDVF